MELSASDLNTLLAFQINLSLNFQDELSIVKGTRTEIIEDTLKTTALLDLSEVSTQNLKNNRLSLLHRLLKIPGLQNSLIAISVEGRPQARNGLLTILRSALAIFYFHG